MRFASNNDHNMYTYQVACICLFDMFQNDHHFLAQVDRKPRKAHGITHDMYSMVCYNLMTNYGIFLLPEIKDNFSNTIKTLYLLITCCITRKMFSQFHFAIYASHIYQSWHQRRNGFDGHNEKCCFPAIMQVGEITMSPVWVISLLCSTQQSMVSHI